VAVNDSYDSTSIRSLHWASDDRVPEIASGSKLFIETVSAGTDVDRQTYLESGLMKHRSFTSTGLQKTDSKLFIDTVSASTDADRYTPTQKAS
jgi:hypothetical protein